MSGIHGVSVRIEGYPDSWRQYCPRLGKIESAWVEIGVGNAETV
jgi:hypothetical protein